MTDYFIFFLQWPLYSVPNLYLEMFHPFSWNCNSKFTVKPFWKSFISKSKSLWQFVQSVSTRLTLTSWHWVMMISTWPWMNFNKAPAECRPQYLLLNGAHHRWSGRQGVMAAMATLLPLYGVMCLVALVTAAVLMMFCKGGKQRGMEVGTLVCSN